jgi:Mn-dependent DtxR family transcriptional regulator
MMAVAAGVLFLLVFLLAPRYGIVNRLLQQARLAIRIVSDDILGLLYRFQEMAPAGARPMQAEDLRQALKQDWSVRLALWRLVRRRWVTRDARGFNLTADGLRQGSQLVRSHRLWESFLCGKMGYCETDVHTPAHHLEHFTDDALQTRLAEASDRPQQDPHQRSIPGP